MVFINVLYLFVKNFIWLKNKKNEEPRYKSSGFPQRLQPHIFNLMIRSLHYILELVIKYHHLDDRKKCIYKFYRELLSQFISNKEIEQYSFSIKVNALDNYKSKSSRNYYIASLYEKYHGITIRDTTYVSVCEVIPLIKNMCKKKFAIMSY